MKRCTFFKTTGLFAAGLLFAPIKALVAIDRHFEKEMLPSGWDFAPGGALTRKMWAKHFWSQYQQESYFMKIISTSGVICPTK